LRLDFERVGALLLDLPEPHDAQVLLGQAQQRAGADQHRVGAEVRPREQGVKEEGDHREQEQQRVVTAQDVACAARQRVLVQAALQVVRGGQHGHDEHATRYRHAQLTQQKRDALQQQCEGQRASENRD
jgi:hypothetical protein